MQTDAKTGEKTKEPKTTTPSPAEQKSQITGKTDKKTKEPSPGISPQKDESVDEGADEKITIKGRAKAKKVSSEERMTFVKEKRKFERERKKFRKNLEQQIEEVRMRMVVI